MKSDSWESPFSKVVGNEDSNRTIGTPDQDIEDWDGQQSEPDTCAIRCQEFIIEQFTGQEIEEYDLIQEAIGNGWYSPGGGTQPEDVGKLLDAHGIPVTQSYDATVFDLASELAQGHKVIVGVDSGELWKDVPEIFEEIEDMFGEGMDHAVVVSGIDTSDPTNVQVIISDPGTGEPAARYPMGEFLDAVEGLDGNFYMVATQDPAPPSLPEMAGFDYDLGHVDDVAGMPWEDFSVLGLLEDGATRFMEFISSLELDTASLDLSLGESGHGFSMELVVNDVSIEADAFEPISDLSPADLDDSLDINMDV